MSIKGRDQRLCFRIQKRRKGSEGQMRQRGDDHSDSGSEKQQTFSLQVRLLLGHSRQHV